MGAFSIWHWISLVFYVAVLYLIVGIPVLKIMRRTGHSGWASILAAIPLVNVVALWVFAFKQWPRDESSSQK